MPKFVLVGSKSKYNSIAKTNDRVYFVKDTQEVYSNGLRFSLGKISWGG